MKKLASVILALCLLLQMTAFAVPVMETASPAEEAPAQGGEARLADSTLIPGVNVFTGTTAAKNFTAADIASIVTTEGSAEIWTNNSLRIYPPYAGANFYTTIRLPYTVDRPALAITNLWLMSTQMLFNGAFYEGPWESDRTFNNVKVDTGEDKAYGSNTVGVRIADMGGTNVDILSNMAVIPYYKITYKVLNPDGTSDADIVRYFLGTAQEKAAIVTSAGQIVGLPASYTPSETLSYDGADFYGWSTIEGAAIAETSFPLAHEDLVLYPVWSNAVANDCIATIYFDEAKTVSRRVSAKEGETVRLPSYDELEAYTPDGKMPEGFTINGKIHAPGDAYTFRANDASIEITPVYKSLIHPEYGELIFLETFESVPETVLYNASTNVRHRVSYINKAYSDIKDYFTIGKADGGGDIVIDDDGTGNMAVRVTKTTDFQWPQFSIRTSGNGFYSISAEGQYTLVADVMVPASDIDKVSGIYAAVYKDGDTNEHLDAGHAVSGTAGGTYYPMQKSIVISKDAHRSLNAHSFYSTMYQSTGTFYVDNIALYVQKAAYKITGLGADGSESITEIFVPGSTLKVPTNADMLRYAYPGYVITGFVRDNETYALGDEIPTTVDDTGIVLEAVYTKKNYKIHYSLGSGNGTLPETALVTGDTFTTPTVSGVTGWRIPGTNTVFSCGQSVQLDLTDVTFAGSLYGDTLYLEAFYANEPTVTGFACENQLEDSMYTDASDSERALLRAAYGAGIIPSAATFDFYRLVTLGEVVDYAAKLYNAYYGVNAVYANTAEAYAAMLDAGVTGEIQDLNATATVLDAVKMFANAVADNEYRMLSAESHAVPEAQKLIRAGIIAKDEDLNAELIYGHVVDMIGKITDSELRNASGVKVYIFGDSLCAGTGAPGHTGWIRKYANYWDTDISFINYAVGGISSIHVPSEAGYRPTLNALKPGDYLFIALGTNDSTLWQDYNNVYNQPLTYEQSLAAYVRYANEAAAAGATPIFICPVGRNTVKDGVYYDGDPDIIRCMRDAAAESGTNVSIINFKDITQERFGAMTADERAEIYYDGVHYTDYGANVVCGIFTELLLASDDYRLGVLKNTLLSEKEGVDYGADPQNPENPTVYDVLTPGINAFTGTLAVKNFTEDDLASIVTTNGTSSLWTDNSLRLYPPSAGVYFNAAIRLPFTVDRPALVVTDLMLQSTQLMVNSGWWGTGWEELKLLYAQKVDTGADTSYGKDTVGITISDMGGTNVNVLSNMAVIPYYKITYKNILPDGTTGADTVKFYLGTEEEKANILNAASGLTGLPTSYTVDTGLTLRAQGYRFLGWAVKEGGRAVQKVSLRNEDVVLYPVWSDYDSTAPRIELDAPTVSGNTVSVTAHTYNAASGAVIVVGLYDADGRLLAAKTAAAASDAAFTFPNAASGAALRAFLLADAQTLSPTCPFVSAALNA